MKPPLRGRNISRAALTFMAVLLLSNCFGIRSLPRRPNVDFDAIRENLVALIDDSGSVIVRDSAGSTVLDNSTFALTGTPGKPLYKIRPDPAGVALIAGPGKEVQPLASISFYIQFEFDSDMFTKETQSRIGDMFAEIASRTRAKQASKVMVIGHTDTVGTDEYNDTLSLERADRVRSKLIELGVSPTIITAAGRGKRDLIERTGNNVRDQNNRAVQLSVW